MGKLLERSRGKVRGLSSPSHLLPLPAQLLSRTLTFQSWAQFILCWGEKISQLPRDGQGSKYHPLIGGKAAHVRNRESQWAKDIMLWHVPGAIRYCHGIRKEKQLCLLLPSHPLSPQHDSQQSNGGQRKELWRQLSPRVTGRNQECWPKAVRECLSLGSKHPRAGYNQSAHTTANVILPWARGHRMGRG